MLVLLLLLLLLLLLPLLLLRFWLLLLLLPPVLLLLLLPLLCGNHQVLDSSIPSNNSTRGQTETVEEAGRAEYESNIRKSHIPHTLASVFPGLYDNVRVQGGDRFLRGLGRGLAVA